MNIFRITVIAVLLSLSLTLTGEATPVKASKTDKCPVCGMFVAKYPDFLAQVIYKDGTYALFDGAKDMFKYYFNIKKYNPTKELTDIAFIYVTDYYGMDPTDGRNAWYVIGSDVFGPMGRELIPFAKEADAKEFMKDHAGKSLIRFDDVTPDVIKGLD
jgi:nitrous oxide reductase accessory protein NosL